MERQLKHARKLHEEKHNENIDFEKTLFEQQTMLQHGTCRITELEESQSELHQQVKSL
jgi:hypothetical protein